MKTTIDMPDLLYRRIKMKAIERGTSVRAVMIHALQRELEDGERKGSGSLMKETKGLYETNDLGFVVMKRTGRKKVVTEKAINRLREQEGV